MPPKCTICGKYMTEDQHVCTMTTHDDGGPAFPHQEHSVETGRPLCASDRGLSLLDYMIGQALAGIIAHYGFRLPRDGMRPVDAAYMEADAMIAEKRRRDNSKQESATTQPSGVSIRDAGFSSRARNALECRAKARTLEDVCKMTPGEVLHLRCIGKQTLNEIERVLASFGLELRREGGAS